MNEQRAFSTIEMMIAMAIMVTVLSAAVIVAFGDQDMLVNGQMNAEALRMAQTLVEQEQELARKDFRLVNPVAVTTNSVYQESVAVEPWPGDPFTTKRVTALVNWVDAHHLTRNIALTTLISNFVSASGADTCSSALSGDWSASQKNDYQLASGDLLPFGFSGTYPLSDVDASLGRLYVAVANTSVNTDKTFLIFDISDQGSKPQYLGGIDNAPTTKTGSSALRVAGTHAYLANAFGANFNTCTAGASCAQLQVVDVSNPAAPSIAVNYKIPTTAPAFVSGSGGSATGKSIFYKDGYIYLGLSKTANGPEFDIIDVHDPAHPAWVGGYSVGSGINAIYVRNNYAYLATDDSSRELMILDVRNPAHPVPAIGSVYNPVGLGIGESVYAVGDDLYFGRPFANNAKQLFVLDITNPSLNMSAPAGMAVIQGGAIRIVVRDYLLFLITSTTGQLQIFNISNPASIIPYATALSLPGTGVALDCEQNSIYAGSNNGNLGFLSVITSGP